MTSVDLSESAEQDAYRAEVRAWYDANATLNGPDNPWAIPSHTEGDSARQFFNSNREWQTRLYDAGFMGIAWPEEYGGGGGEGWMARIEREISRDYSELTGFPGATTAMLGPALLRHASEDQKREYLPKLLSAELTFCQLFSEPGAGSDLASLATRAEIDGDELVVTGQKVWNSAAQYCDWGFLLVRTDPDAPKHRGITFVLVDMSSPGIEVRPLVQMNRSAHFNEVFLSEVRIPMANMIGELNQGWAVTRAVLAGEAAFIGGVKLPCGDNLIELARRHDRLTDPIVRQNLVQFLIRDRVTTWMGEQVQQAIRRGEMPPMDPGLLKLMATQNKVLSGNLAMELSGPAGLVNESEPARWSHHELMIRFAISIGGGTSEVLRNNIGERSLGLPREPGYDKNQPWRDIPR